MTPGASAASLFQQVGKAETGAQGAVLFGCQTAAPPDGPCYGPDQVRAAYGVQSLIDEGHDGSGRTIVIIDAFGSPTIADDLATFDTLWGLPDPPSFQTVTPFGNDAASADPEDVTGWAGETTLDVEWAHAIAPGANILLVVAKSDNDSDILDATQWVSDHNAGDVISQSYGEAEQCMGDDGLAAQHELFAELTGQGITLLASSGDSGSAQPTCDSTLDDVTYFKAASTPASDPYVTGVGGTDLIADGTTGAYQSESTWNETELLGGAAAGGGGVSVVYSRPSYQAPVQKDKMRTVPDVAYSAAVIQGVLVVWSSSGQAPQGVPLVFRFGGTSAGSPQWAGLVAIADQIAGNRIGPMNKALYQVGKNHKQSTYFHDIADGSNNGLGSISGFTAEEGYDLATGLGSPVADQLVPFLAQHAGSHSPNYGSVASSIGGAKGHRKHTN